MERTRALLEENDQGNNSVWCYRHGLLRRMLALGPADGDGETDGEWAYRLWYVMNGPMPQPAAACR